MANKVIKHPIKALDAFQPLYNFSLRGKYIFLAVIGFTFYANSISNKFAFDDNLIIVHNAYVQMGISGIPKILANDSYASYYNFTNDDPTKGLSGGRYRPLSVIIFAIEKQFFGNSNLLPYFGHLINVLAYIACILALFYFLGNFLFKKIQSGSDIAFLSTLLFSIHPIHTEVVANIKSLDEILSLFFILLTFIFSLKYMANKKNSTLVIGLSCFLLAMLSKEYAVTLLFFIPFLFYLLASIKPRNAIMASIPYYIVFAFYMTLRYHAVGFHINKSAEMIINNNPYLFATYSQKIATEWFVLGKYFRLLSYPYPLACDYSYFQIPYHNFTQVSTILSILLYLAILVWSIILISTKNILSFAVLFFLFNIFIISNFVLNIGATMGERLVFHSSLGFVIILSYYIIQLISKMPIYIKRQVMTGALLAVGIASFAETVIRNTQWRDNTSLFIHDVAIVPNSFVVNKNASRAYIEFATEETNTDKRTAYFDSAYKYLLRTRHFVPSDEGVTMDLGGIYCRIGLLDSARICWDRIHSLHPDYPGLQSNYMLLSQYYLNAGISLGKNGNLHKSVVELNKALEIDSTNSHIWYNIGIAYYHLQQFDSARYAWKKTLLYNPDITEQTNATRHLNDLLQK